MNIPDLTIHILQFVGYGRDKKENIFRLRLVSRTFQTTIDHFFHVPYFSQINIQRFLKSRDVIKKDLCYGIHDCVEFEDNYYFCGIKSIDYDEYARLTRIKNTLFFENEDEACPYMVHDIKFKWIGINI